MGLGVLGIGTAATLAATFALAQQYGELPKRQLEHLGIFQKLDDDSRQYNMNICICINESIFDR